jgi:hypothetical protein
MKAYAFPKCSPTTTPSGSGPLLSLRVSNEFASSLFELNGVVAGGAGEAPAVRGQLDAGAAGTGGCWTSGGAGAGPPGKVEVMRSSWSPESKISAPDSRQIENERAP